jgi:hypothetical protein
MQANSSRRYSSAAGAVPAAASHLEPDVCQHGKVARAASQDSPEQLSLLGVCSTPLNPPGLRGTPVRPVRSDHPNSGDVVAEQTECAARQAVATRVGVAAHMHVCALAVWHERVPLSQLLVELGKLPADAHLHTQDTALVL